MLSSTNETEACIWVWSALTGCLYPEQVKRLSGIDDSRKPAESVRPSSHFRHPYGPGKGETDPDQ